MKTHPMKIVALFLAVAVVVSVGAGCETFRNTEVLYLGVKDKESSFTKVDGEIVRVTTVKSSAMGTYEIRKRADQISHEEIIGNYIYYSMPSEVGSSFSTAADKGARKSIKVLERFKVRIDAQQND